MHQHLHQGMARAEACLPLQLAAWVLTFLASTLNTHVHATHIYHSLVLHQTYSSMLPDTDYLGSPSISMVCAACRLRGIKLGNFDFCSSPLQLGSLRGNAFRILMRDVDTHDEDHVSSPPQPPLAPSWPHSCFHMGGLAARLVPHTHWQCRN